MQISERAKSGIDAKRIKERLAHKVRRLSLENAELRKVLTERDGGSHDADCKALHHWGPAKPCNCGHDEVVKLLETSKGK